MSNIERKIDTDDLLAAINNLRGHRCNAQTRYLAHVDAVYEDVAALADQLTGAVEALEEILDDLGGNRHIRWAPNFPEVDHAIQVAQGAIAAARGR